MSELSSKQRIFAVDMAKLILYIDSKGYGIAVGEVKRSNEQAAINAIGESGRMTVAKFCRSIGLISLAAALEDNGKNNGVLKSVHQDKLAVDLDLFLNGVYQSSTEAHRQFGEWWEKLGPDHHWGGRWGDGNHYSISYNGVK